jgi:hypothetical protein
MKINKFKDYIAETKNTPEEYVKTALQKIKFKIDSYFENPKRDEESDKMVTMSDALKKGKDKEKDKNKISFSDLGLNLVHSEFSKYSSLNDNVKFYFEDSENSRYDLYISIPLEFAVSDNKENTFSYKDIKKCYVIFKKYSEDGTVYPPLDKTVEIDSIDDDFIVSLKVEYDQNFGSKEELEIEI